MKTPSSTIIYREGTPSDIPQLQKVSIEAYGQFKSIISPLNWEKWKLNFENEATFIDLFKIATCFVCEIENEICGTAFLIPSGNPFLLFESEWSYIRFLGVSPKQEGKGIGKKLTQLCIAAASKANEKYIALHTSEFQNAARHIYESLGFERQQEFELYDKCYWIYKLNLI
jgi:ribosomal protein S18 acetylase RimI-like enzyme